MHVASAELGKVLNCRTWAVVMGVPGYLVSRLYILYPPLVHGMAICCGNYEASQVLERPLSPHGGFPVPKSGGQPFGSNHELQATPF